MRSEIYTDTHGAWRWRLVADDTGVAVASSAEGFTNYADCLNGLDAVKAWASSLRPQSVARSLPADPRTLIGMFNEPNAENIALLAMVDRLFGR